MKPEIKDDIAEYVSTLKKSNFIKCSNETAKVLKYHEGYEQALEDILKRIKRGE